jgi:hypothetical protein
MEDDLRAIAGKLALTNEQSALFGVLLGRSERIARMYLGAVIALKDDLDPERLSKAAHEMRELMEKISEIVDVEIRALGERMGQKVGELEAEFTAMLSQTKLKPPMWDGVVDQPLKQCLEKMREFFDWKKEHQPKRREEITNVLRALDGPGRLLPGDIEKANVNSWMDTKQFFDGVAHHRFQPAENEFTESVAYVEGVLLNKLNPKTFADFDSVDAIIEEGESK